MEMALMYFIILVILSGLTEGSGVLPDGPLNAAVGETVMFTTTLTPTETPFLTLAWTSGAKNIITSNTVNTTGPEYEGRITLFPSTGSLELRSLTLDDAGEYSVVIVPAGEAAEMGRTTLAVYEKVSSVSVTSSSTDLVEFSGSVSLSCSASGSSLSFLWLNGSSEVTASDRVQLTDGGSSLTIITVTRSDQGPFRCRVSNPVSTGTSDPVNLSISYGPENINLILSPPQGYFAVGSDISLTCSVGSRPPAQFKWFLNGDQLLDTGSELRLMNVQMSQSGNYSCQAFNSKTLRSQTSQPSAITVLVFTERAGVLPYDRLNAAVGETVMFTTTLTPTEKPFQSVNWSFNFSTTIIVMINSEETIGPEYEGRITFFPSTASLELRSLTLDDTGEYGVNIVQDGKILSGRTTLVIYEKVSNVSVTSSSTDLVEFSGSVSLSCSASGSSLSFLWLNGSSEVTASDRVQLTDGGSTLTIINVTRFDQGPFRCRVSNPVSTVTSDPINLSISYGPENIDLILFPPQGYFAVGSDISLTCSVGSRPPAQFKWFLNGDEQLDTGSELRLMDVKMSQSGNYSCQAFNSKTLRSQTSQPSAITVLEKISGASATPSTNLPVEGTSVSLTCEASGSVFARNWMKDGSDLTPTDNMILSDNNRVLTFDTVNRKDNGEYFCQISNPVSSDEAKYVMIVNYGPENVQIKGPNKINKGTLKLTCSAESTPSARFTWFFNGTEILNTSAEYIKEEVELSDSGNYTCQAWNNITERTSSSTVHGLTVTEKSSGCAAGCIAGIVIACCVIVAAAVGGGYYIYKKKFNKNPQKQNTEQDENMYENISITRK